MPMYGPPKPPGLGGGGGLGSILSQLLGDFGKDLNLGDIMKGGSDMFGAYKAGQMMDFQKGAYKDNQRKSNILFDQQQEDRDALHKLDF